MEIFTQIWTMRLNTYLYAWLIIPDDKVHRMDYSYFRVPSTLCGKSRNVLQTGAPKNWRESDRSEGVLVYILSQRPISRPWELWKVCRCKHIAIMIIKPRRQAGGLMDLLWNLWRRPVCPNNLSSASLGGTVFLCSCHWFCPKSTAWWWWYSITLTRQSRNLSFHKRTHARTHVHHTHIHTHTRRVKSENNLHW